MTSLPIFISASLEGLLLQMAPPAAKGVDAPSPEAKLAFPTELLDALLANSVEVPVMDSPVNFPKAQAPKQGPALQVVPKPLPEVHTIASIPEEPEVSENAPIEVSATPVPAPAPLPSVAIPPMPMLKAPAMPAPVLPRVVHSVSTPPAKTELPVAHAPIAVKETAPPRVEVAFAALLRPEETGTPKTTADIPVKPPATVPLKPLAAALQQVEEKVQVPARAGDEPSRVPARVPDIPAGSQGPTPALPVNESNPMPAALAVVAPAIAVKPVAPQLPSAPAALPSPIVEPQAVNSTTMDAPRPVHQLSLRVETETAQTTDVRLVEQNGDIRVVVRASDPALASTLRTDLSDLVSRLAHHDLSADVWHPALAAASAVSSSAASFSASTDAGAQEDRGSGGPFAQLKQDDRQQQSSRERRGAPPWLDDFEQASGERPPRKEQR